MKINIFLRNIINNTSDFLVGFSKGFGEERGALIIIPVLIIYSRYFKERPIIDYDHGFGDRIFSIAKLIIWILLIFYIIIWLLEVAIKVIVYFYHSSEKTKSIYKASMKLAIKKSATDSIVLNKIYKWTKGCYFFILKIYKEIFLI